MTRATPSAALLLLACLLMACGEAPPPPAAAPPAAAPVADEAGAHRAAGVALESLSRRKYNVTGCAAAEARVAADPESAVPSSGCSVLVARRPDGTWLVVVRSAAQLGNVWAKVTVSAGGEGVQHVEYKP
jgi:hypothetical protein